MLKIVGYFLAWLPRRIFLWLGFGLGHLLRLCGFRYAIASSNVALAFPYLTAEQRQKFLVEHYREMGVLFLEMLGSFYKFGNFVDRLGDLQGEQHLKDALAKGKGVFVMTAHLGNWEVLCVSGPRIFEAPSTMVTKELKPQWFHRVVALTRELLGVHMACEPRTMQGILRTLKKNGIVGFVMDQYTGAPVGARVPFFGHPVGSHTALATLALRTGVPVVPAIAVRKPNGRYLLRFDRPLATLTHEDHDTAVLLNTAQYVKHTEAWVKEFPLQWMWVHRRWKGDLSPLPPGAIGEMLK